MSERIRTHPIYASVYDRYNQGAERTWLGEGRALAIAHARGKVVEIGAGTGMNLLHYRDVEKVVACEPDPAYLKQLHRRLPEAKVPVAVLQAAAERLPFANASFDTAVSTLVMCSVDDPEQTARELRRVLRPDGTLLLIEHICNEATGFSRMAQNMAVPFWKLFLGGCHPNRASLRTLARAGFNITELDRFNPPHVPSVMFPFIVATARPI